MDFIWTKKAFRDIKNNKLKVIPLILMLIFGTTLSLGLFTEEASGTQVLNVAWNQHHYHQALITVKSMPEEQLASYVTKTMQQTNITPQFEIRTFFQANIFSPQVNKSLNAYIYAINGTRSLAVDDLMYESGTTLYQSTMKNAAVIDKINAQTSGISSSKNLSISSIYGEFNVNVVNHVFSPEYLWVASFKSEFLPVFTGPIIWMKLSGLEQIANSTNVVNQLALYFTNPTKDQQNFLSAFVQIAGPDTVLSIQGRDPLLSIFTIFYSAIAVGMGAIFYGAAMIMTFIIISRFVEEEFPILGLYKAMGMKNKEIVGSTLYFALVLGLIGSIIGVLLGIILSIPIYSTFTGIIRAVPGAGLTIDPVIVLLYILIPIIITMTATLFASRKIFTIQPEEAIRPTTTMQIPGISKITSLYTKIRKTHFSPFRIYSLRYLSQHKSKTFGVFVGILLATSIISFSFIFLVAYNDSLGNKYQYDNWNLDIVFNSYINQSDVPTILNLSDFHEPVSFEPQIVASIRFSSDLTNTYTVTGLTPNTHFQYFENNKTVVDNQLLISKDLALAYNLHIGGQANITTTNGSIMILKISGILSTGDSREIYTDINTARYLAGLNNSTFINGVLIQTNDPTTLQTNNKDNPAIKSFISLDDLKAQLTQVNSIFTFVFYGFIGAGIIIGVIITVSIITVTIGERKNDFINFRSLGIRNREMFSIIFAELVYASIIAIVLGIIIGNEIMVFGTNWFASVGYLLAYSPDPVAILGSIISVVVIGLISVYISLRSLFKTNIAEATLARMLG